MSLEKAYINIEKLVALSAKDNLIIFIDNQTESFFKKFCKDVAKKVNKFLCIHLEKDISQRPIKRFTRSLKEKIIQFKPTVSIYAADVFPGELIEFRKPLMNFLTNELKVRHAHMPGISKQLMLTGMAANYERVSIVTKKVYNFVKNTDMIFVTAEKTDLKVQISKKLKWLALDGKLTKQGHWVNLPEGEVFTCPEKVDGVISAFVLGDFFTKKYGLLKFPLVVEIEKSRAKKVFCKTKNIEKEFIKYIKSYKNSDRVGEFAIGTLIDLKKFTGNLLQDEKFPGIHIAFGSSYSDKTGANWDSKSHIDLIPLNCTIKTRKDLIMKDGRFLFKI